MLSRLCLSAVAIFTAAPAHGQSWGDVDRLLDQPPLDRSLWGVAVADSTGRLLYARNAERLFMPASSTKLVVAAAAAVLLPPDWTVRTSLYGTGPVEAGVLRGHLVLYGRGDPTMARRCYAVDTTQTGACRTDPFDPLRVLARGLRASGVLEIAGDIVGDGSWFEPEMIHPTWEWGDLVWWYAAPVSGLAFNDNIREVRVSPARDGGPATLEVWPDLGPWSVDNRTRTIPAGGRRTLTMSRGPAPDVLIVSGDLPRDSARRESVAVGDPVLSTALALRQVLAEEGIVVQGGVRATTDSMASHAGRATGPLAEVTSRPVRDWLIPILSASQNWYAEMLVKQIGRHAGREGSWREGLRVLRRFLIDSVGVDSTQFALSDGSGLSTLNLVTPAAFVRLLTWMRRHPSWPVFAAGLPVAGRSGTLRTRFRGTPLEGRVIAKTGTLTLGNSLTGFLERPDGTLLIFSIQGNHHALGSRAMAAAIDSLVGVLGR